MNLALTIRSERGGYKFPFNSYRIEGDVAYLELTNRAGASVAEILLDIEDLRTLEAEGHRWGPTHNGFRIYATRRDANGIIRLHRQLMGAPKELVIDHINRNSLDNRRSNLRAITHRENCLNSYGYTGTKTGIRNLHHTKNGRLPLIVRVQARRENLYSQQVATINIGRITAIMARAQFFGAGSL